jgi:hypothetical protein
MVSAPSSTCPPFRKTKAILCSAPPRRKADRLPELFFHQSARFVFDNTGSSATDKPQVVHGLQTPSQSPQSALVNGHGDAIPSLSSPSIELYIQDKFSWLQNKRAPKSEVTRLISRSNGRYLCRSFPVTSFADHTLTI